jgi:hypothetical protein
MLLLGEFPFDPNAREAFTCGELREDWFRRYPMLFEGQDRVLAEHQPKNHFFEWLGAIRIYEETGWLSLLEKYQFRQHARKHELFTSLVPHNVSHLLTDSHFFGARQGPDLFVYAPDRTDWFFCEVKGGPDRLRETQSTLFATLERITGRPVRLIRFLPESLSPSKGNHDGA